MQNERIAYLTEEEREELAFTLRELPRIFTENTHRMADYEKRKYMPAVQEICKTYLPPIQLYHNFCKAHPERGEAAAKECAQSFMEGAEAYIAGRLSGNKWKDRIAMEQFRMVMAAFVVPCLREMKAENGQMLVDEICRLWKKNYPRYVFQQTTVSVLQNGFKMRGFF